MLTVLLSAAKEALMSAGSVKQKVLEVIEKLPADATLEDAFERLVLLAKTERGLAELDAGQGGDHAAAKRRLLRCPTSSGHLRQAKTSTGYARMSPTTPLAT